jgi:hypothetical protein
MVPGGEAISRAFGPTAKEILAGTQAKADETKRLDASLMRDPWAVGGNIAGGAVTSSVLPGGPVVQGMTAGYLRPTAGDESVAANMALGAGGGYLGNKIAKGLGRLVSPNVAPEVRRLADAGVTMTPGQILGGAANKVEQRATSLPIMGDAIANARRRSVEDVNRVAINRALDPIGEKLPKGMLGRDAVQYADDALGSAYEAVLPKLTTQADQAFMQEVQTLRGMVQGGNMGPAEAQQFNRLLQDKVLSKFMGQNAVTGQTMKGMESDLGRLGSSYMRDPSADKRQLGGAILELQASLRDLVQRSNPEFAEQLSKINAGWANFKRVQRAAGSVAAEDGIFSPAQLQNAVKALDRSKDKARFAEGRALMQDLSDSAKKVLGPNVPDSGTPGRLMNAATIASSVVQPHIPAGLLAGGLGYSAPAVKMLQKVLIERPEAAPLIAAELNRLAPYVGLLGAATAPRIGQ